MAETDGKRCVCCLCVVYVVLCCVVCVRPSDKRTSKSALLYVTGVY